MELITVLQNGLDQIEIWKDVEGLEGLYQVSSFGRIMHNYRKCRWLIVKSYRERTGYELTRLWFELGKCKGVRVHRLVAKAFIPNPNNYPEINHINGIKHDNRVENLEWCTRKYNAEYINILDPTKNRGENGYTAKLSNKQVLEIYDLAWNSKLSRELPLS